ncbi:hypothetical protein [Streptomyces sp. NPDC001678]|uniref:hypothetical protein n=1 Tax=Streptomyces sp. NPDC001678 TaxID=3364599 RepID=UPI0036895C09
MAVTTSRVAAAPPLPAHPDPQAAAVLASGLLQELSYAFDGPFHFLLPDRFDTNLAAFRAALAEAGVAGRVYYAKKANKAAVWVERCAATGAGVDVASAGELREALAHGVRGEDITVTGPAKHEQLLRVAVLQGALVHEALRRLPSLPPGSTMVALVNDGGEKYLDTVFDDGWMAARDLLDPVVEREVGDLLGTLRGH